MSQAGIHHRVCQHDLLFDFVPDSYFEGVPLGNGELGAMLWFEEDRMVLSLDRADIWEHRADQSLEPGMDFATVLRQPAGGQLRYLPPAVRQNPPAESGPARLVAPQEMGHSRFSDIYDLVGAEGQSTSTAMVHARCVCDLAGRPIRLRRRSTPPLGEGQFRSSAPRPGAPFVL